MLIHLLYQMQFPILYFVNITLGGLETECDAIKEELCKTPVLHFYNKVYQMDIG